MGELDQGLDDDLVGRVRVDVRARVSLSYRKPRTKEPSSFSTDTGSRLR